MRKTTARMLAAALLTCILTVASGEEAAVQMTPEAVAEEIVTEAYASEVHVTEEYVTEDAVPAGESVNVPMADYAVTEGGWQYPSEALQEAQAPMPEAVASEETVPAPESSLQTEESNLESLQVTEEIQYAAPEAAGQTEQAQEPVYSESNFTESIVTESAQTAPQAAEMPAEAPVEAAAPMPEAAAEEAAGEVHVYAMLLPAGDIREGDTVTLKGFVEGADQYLAIWQAYDTSLPEEARTWEQIAEGTELEMTAESAMNAVYYRCVVLWDNRVLAFSDVLKPLILPPEAAGENTAVTQTAADNAAAAETAAPAAAPTPAPDEPEMIEAPPPAQEPVYTVVMSISPFGGGEALEAPVPEEASAPEAVSEYVEAKEEEEPAVDAVTVPVQGTASGEMENVTDGNMPVPESAEAEALEAASSVTSEVKVTISSSCPAVIRHGEMITLTGTVDGAEGLEMHYQWECDRGNGFEPIEGANQAQYSFPADADSLSWVWRLIVTCYGT